MFVRESDDGKGEAEGGGGAGAGEEGSRGISAAADDPYVLLGVERNATEKEIRSAYRVRALRMHPDRYPNATADERLIATRRFQVRLHARTLCLFVSTACLCDRRNHHSSAR